MTDFWQRPRPKVLTRHLGDLGILHVISRSDEHVVLGIRHYGSIPLILRGRMIAYLWARVAHRVSKMWLLGELGILLFCSPGFCDVGCWGSFARAFLLGRLISKGTEISRYRSFCIWVFLFLFQLSALFSFQVSRTLTLKNRTKKKHTKTKSQNQKPKV